MRSVTVGLVIGALAVLGGPGNPAAACSMPGPRFAIVGQALSKGGGNVVYRVDEVTNIADGEMNAPTAGGKLAVKYDGDERFIDVGQRYRVFVDRLVDGTLFSGVKTAEELCGGGGTGYADGSEIDTGNTLLGMRIWTALTIGAVAVIVAGLLSTFAWGWHRRRRALPL